MREALLRVMTYLHARGMHAAVVAALIVMPTVATIGYLTRGIDREQDGSTRGELRPTLPDPAASDSR